jgi:DUF4097 and DUF4098 domain-containing protein YvlB
VNVAKTIMRIAALITLIGAAAVPVSAQDRDLRLVAVAVVEQTQQERERIEREYQRAVEQAERERQRALEQAERDRQRASEQAQRDRERASQQAERDRQRAQQRGNRVEEIERTTRTFRIGSTGELHLANIAGDIVISRGSGNEAQVEIVKTAHGQTSEDAKEMLKLVEIDVVERPNRAEIRTRYPAGNEMRDRFNRRNFNVSVAFNVTVPAATRIRAQSISGSVSARDVRGDAVLKSVSGTVRLTNGGGGGSAESISGNVELTDASLDSPWSASSASGTIVLKRVKAPRLNVSSISGNVILDDVACPAVEAQAVSGNVQFSGPLARSSRYELSSHSGTVNVGVAGGSGFEVEATSFSGSVRSDFQFTNREEPGRGRFNRTLRGVFGDGGAVLDLSTFSGSIVITKR